MLSPGEQPSTAKASPRRVLALLLASAILAAFLFAQSNKLTEYKLYFTADRSPVTLDLQALSEDWTESRLRAQFVGLPVRCQDYQGPLSVQRACALDVRSANGVPALFVSFFFANGRLNEVSINVPWWSHQTAFQYLVSTFGRPDASQLLPRAGVRLQGWRLGNGSAVFFNRDRPFNPLQWNSIFWRSRTACDLGACFAK